MLTELRIQNFAIIDHLVLNFETGLVVFTGETGAGKSIIFDAVETLVGGRADSTLVRSGANHALLEGTFRITSTIKEPVHAILRREELLDDSEYLTLNREIKAEGRSSARVNGRTVTVSLLKELGEILVDLHGQSEHLSLLRTGEHLSLLDRYADIDIPLTAYQKIYRQLQKVRRELVELRRDEQQINRRIDLLSYQIGEIESAHLQPAEEDDLKAERNRLANAESLANLCQEALQAIDDNNLEIPSATDLFGQAVHALLSLKRLDPSQSELSERADLIFEQLTDLTRELRLYLESVEFNPKRLDTVEERLNLIQVLKRKYGSSIQDVLEFARKSRQELESIQRSGERQVELQAEELQLLAHLSKMALELSNARQEAASRLSQQVQRELDDLNMEGAQFRVDFERKQDPNGLPVAEDQRVAFDSNGVEQVEFLIAPNPGEGFKPLVKIASGGETSRLMLALKNVLVQADHVPTLIFDEIDQGIGGRVGIIVGQKLWQLARRHQVLCITHLPQLAAFGEQHNHVEKIVTEGRTLTRVELLDGDRRVRELAQMFGEVSAGTLVSAQEILQVAQNVTLSG